MMTLEALAAQRLEQWRAAGLSRRPATFSTGQDAVAGIDSDDYVLLSSSNYLGLSTHPQVIRAASDALERYGVGSGGSRLTTGSTLLHTQAERAFARFVGYPAGVLFGSGYDANISTLQALAGPETTIVSDARNHASIIDGCRLAKARGATVKVVAHRDVSAVAAALQARLTKHAVVVTDGLFSMDGTLAPLPDLVEVCRAHGAFLMVDDAHAIGTLGDQGRGTAEHLQMEQKPDIVVATASKALGAQGGCVLTGANFAELLRQQARSFVYSTSLGPSVCAAIIVALNILGESTDLVERLRHNTSYLRNRLGLKSTYSGPIVPIPVGGEADAVAVADRLRAQGWFAPAIRWPSVPRGKAIIRATVMAAHTEQQLAGFATEVRSQLSARSR